MAAARGCSQLMSRTRGTHAASTYPRMAPSQDEFRQHECHSSPPYLPLTFVPSSVHVLPHRSTYTLIGPRTPSSVHMLPHRSTYTLIGLTSAEVLLVDKHDAYLASGHYVHRRAVIDKARWASCNHEEAFLLNASKTTAGREPCGLLTGHNLASSVLRNSELQCRNNSVYLRMQAQT